MNKPIKVVSSRAGRTNPVNKVVNNADLKSKARRLNAGLFSYWWYSALILTSRVRREQTAGNKMR